MEASVPELNSYEDAFARKGQVEEMIRFGIDAMRKGVPEKEIWATLEVMSSKELQITL